MISNLFPKKRNFLPADFKIIDWDSLKDFYELLLSQEIDSVEELKKWLLSRSELESVIEEDAGWRYIHTTCDTGNQVYATRYEEYVKNILPNLIPLSHQLDQKVIGSIYKKALLKERGYNLLFRSLEVNAQLYRPENIPLITKIQLQAQEYGKIISEMTIDREGKEITMQQAATYLESIDRKLREEIYDKMCVRRLQDKDRLDTLYNSLIKDRNALARNAGHINFIDYSFVTLKRFDYSPEDCASFHTSIQQAVVPLLCEIAEERKRELGVERLRPWDHAVDYCNREPLQPFKDIQDLLDKTKTVLNKLHPFLGECLNTMQRMERFDLESRKGKAPGGYNYPLLESGVPFIFMNATPDFENVITMLHESGHAVHSFLMHDLLLQNFKQITSEMAELASMSMELLTMGYWEVFFDKQEDLKRAKKDHLESIIKRLAWVAVIDKFQHWVYANPDHTIAERTKAWVSIFNEFSDNVTSWEDYETAKEYLWQKQLHLFEVPFYYIEYGIAQLGAIDIWKNYQANPIQTLQQYLDALKLGYTHSLPYMYETAGTKFDLAIIHIHSLIKFVKEEWNKLS